MSGEGHREAGALAAAPCPACGAERETPLACGACGALESRERPLSPFEALGLEPRWKVDSEALRRRLIRASRLVHPDYHAARGGNARELAEKSSAELNRAHALVADDLARADWLIGWLGGPSEGEERKLPQEFLMEVLEWNETLEEARAAAPGTPARERLVELEALLAARREEGLADLAALLEPLPARGSPALVDARRELNALRYLERARAQIVELRLEEAAAP